MAQPTTFSEFPRTFSTTVLTNPSGSPLDTGVFDKTAVYKFLCFLTGTATGIVNITHYNTDGVTVVETIPIVSNGAPAEFYWLWLVETNQRVKAVLPGALTGTFAITFNVYQAAAGPSIGWM